MIVIGCLILGLALVLGLGDVAQAIREYMLYMSDKRR